MANLPVHKKSEAGSLAETSKEKKDRKSSKEDNAAKMKGATYEWNEEVRERGRKDKKALDKTRFDRGENDGSSYFL